MLFTLIHLRLQPRVGEFQTDHVEDVGPSLLAAIAAIVGIIGAAAVAVLKVLVPLLHSHRRVLLGPVRSVDQT